MLGVLVTVPIQGLSGRVLKLQGCLAGAHTICMQTSLPRADVDGNCSTHVYKGGQIERPSQEEWWLTELFQFRCFCIISNDKLNLTLQIHPIMKVLPFRRS
jgi:hypothetical protein